MNVLALINNKTFRSLALKCPFCGKREARKHINNHVFLTCSCSWSIIPHEIKTLDELIKFYKKLNCRKPFKIKLDMVDKSISVHDVIDPAKINKEDKSIVYMKIHDMEKALEAYD